MSPSEITTSKNWFAVGLVLLVLANPIGIVYMFFYYSRFRAVNYKLARTAQMLAWGFICLYFIAPIVGILYAFNYNMLFNWR